MKNGIKKIFKGHKPGARIRILKPVSGLFKKGELGTFTYVQYNGWLNIKMDSGKIFGLPEDYFEFISYQLEFDFK